MISHEFRKRKKGAGRDGAGVNGGRVTVRFDPSDGSVAARRVDYQRNASDEGVRRGRDGSVPVHWRWERRGKGTRRGRPCQSH